MWEIVFLLVNAILSCRIEEGPHVFGLGIIEPGGCVHDKRSLLRHSLDQSPAVFHDALRCPCNEQGHGNPASETYFLPEDFSHLDQG
jgi:hypothetical protein